MLEILLTQMRREGFEMTVSPPKVLIKKDDNGNKVDDFILNQNPFNCLFGSIDKVG